MAKTEEKQDEKVVVKFNGPTGWDIDLAGRGLVSLRPGEEFEFNPREPTELRALLGIIKEVNRPRTNRRIRLKPQTSDGYKEQEFIERFVITKGLENLPEAIRKHAYSASNMLSPSEKKAILELCPQYFEQSSLKNRRVVLSPA